jgi:hypothetical protein
VALDGDLAPWGQAEWFETAHRWIRTEMARQQMTMTGPIEQIHERPWSTILRVPTTLGDKFFKGSAAFLAHEAALTAYLSGKFPGCMPRLLAVDDSRGWMIMEDGGGRLRERLQAQPDLGLWEKLLPSMADLQLEAAKDVTRLLALGAPDRRLARLPQLYRQLTAEAALFRIDLPLGLTGREYRRLQETADLVTQKCRELAGYGIPDSLHHGDFHDGNIFFDRGRYLFFDWGDCSVSHPYFTMRTVYVSVENTFRIAEDDPMLNRLRDAYLEPWRSLETEERLLEAFALAEQLWAISSMLNWYQVIASLAREYLSQIER